MKLPSLAYFLVGLGALLAMLPRALAVSPAATTSKLDCGSFQVTAKTVWQPPNDDIFKQATSQVISFFNPSRHITRKLDLKQHFSRDPEIDGQIASDWHCVHPKSGEDYLFVHFYCSNDGAQSCKIAMDGDSSEWTQGFDSSGTPFFKIPLRKTQRELDHLKATGLWGEIEGYVPRSTDIFDW